MFRFSLKNLLSQKIRSLLSMIAIAIAVFGVICIFSFSQGIKSTINSALNMVEGVVILEKGTPDPKLSTVPTSLEPKLRSSDGVENVIPWIWALATSVENKNMVSRGMMEQEAIAGVDLKALSRTPKRHLYPRSLVDGRFLQPGDFHHVVISNMSLDRHGKSLGDQISVRGVSLKIVGVYDTGNKFMDSTLVIPMKLAREMKGMDARYVSDLFVVPNGKLDTDQLKRKLETAVLPYRFERSEDRIVVRSSDESSGVKSRISTSKLYDLYDISGFHRPFPRIWVSRDHETSEQPKRSASANSRNGFIGVPVENGTLKRDAIVKSVVRGTLSVRDGEPSVVLSETGARELNADVSDQINIRGTNFIVRGIYQPERNDGTIYGMTSMESARKLVNVESDSVHDFVLVSDGSKPMEEVLPVVRRRLLNVDVRSAEDWKSDASSIMADVNVLLFLISSLAVVVGTVGIVNTMLMSVSERTSEFGILLANGWSKTDILKLLIHESLLLGIIGGTVGILLGWVTVQLIPVFLEISVNPETSPLLLLYCFLLSVLVGVAGGLYPAYRATRMDPIDAIKSIR